MMDEQNESKLHIGGADYTIPGDYTIGEAQELKRRFDGLTPQKLMVGLMDDPTDTDFLIPMAWVVLRRELDPSIEPDDERILSTGVIAMIADDEDIEEEAEEPRPPEVAQLPLRSDSSSTAATG